MLPQQEQHAQSLAQTDLVDSMDSDDPAVQRYKRAEAALMQLKSQAGAAQQLAALQTLAKILQVCCLGPAAEIDAEGVCRLNDARLSEHFADACVLTNLCCLDVVGNNANVASCGIHAAAGCLVCCH